MSTTLQFSSPTGPGNATIVIDGCTASFLNMLGYVLFALAGWLHVWQWREYRIWWFNKIGKIPKASSG